jgi:catechol 2,3-dioxygenase-like lactoylglutathione lyase family enzyme
MSVRFNHTIVLSRDKRASATFLSEVLGLSAPTPFAAFLVVQLDNGVSLDYLDAGDQKIASRHYAFLIDESDFDPIFERVRARGLTYWADPFKQRPNEINRNDGGRGFYFDDPDGHLMEVLTRPYGSGASS